MYILFRPPLYTAEKLEAAAADLGPDNLMMLHKFVLIMCSTEYSFNMYDDASLKQIFEKIPNTMFHFSVSELDGIRDDALILANRLKKFTEHVRYTVKQGMKHDFPLLSSACGGPMQSSNRATKNWMTEMSLFIKEHIGSCRNSS